MKAVIIEDETAAVRNLKAILKDVAPEIDIVATLDSIRQSVSWFSSHPMPDLLFMDIHLADGESFHIFQEIEINVPVIFTTAYDEYALKAFQVNSIDYLLKPIKSDDVALALNKFNRISQSDREQYISRVLKTLAAPPALRTLLIPYKDKIIPVSCDSIAFFYSKNEKVSVYTLNGMVYSVDKSLNGLAELLDPEQFYRANRQFIIARHAIRELTVWSGNRLSVALGIPTEEYVLISKERVSEFKRWLVQS
ncbi:LytTR family DNA-binding domain-containing protein [Parabacteroides sp. Marseille-P3160]|uniref:LytR/AlgR family response regulator transcription factor n=1 Tax=Parabacteroides sp. Marseille-P3160 TaxID=1917887 RepID=UPI0009BB2E09|nr:LytTR family DNA-binding domain-containing protein [Parabacteroides sp. Marseille-P3160]